MNPNDFANPVGLYFPKTETEKENATKAIIDLIGAVPLQEGVPVRFIALLPNGAKLYLIENDT